MRVTPNIEPGNYENDFSYLLTPEELKKEFEESKSKVEMKSEAKK